MPRKNTPEQASAAKKRAQEKAHARYLANREMYMAKGYEQAKRQKEDRILAKAGDEEAKRRTALLNQKRKEYAWARGTHIPRTEWKAITAAIAFVLEPVRKQRRNTLQKRRDSEMYANALQGDTKAIAERELVRKRALGRQLAWYERTRKKADAGDKEAQHLLWKRTKAGREWLQNQLILGLGTTLTDKQ